MAILVDDRIGSKDLVPRLRRLGVSTTLTRLDYADAAFVGRGRQGTPWQVGIEIKTISDLASCIQTGRFAGHQLPGLLQTYDDVWLCVEGRWRAGREGLLEVDLHGRGHWFALSHGRQRWMLRDVVNYLHSVVMLGGVRLARTETRDETARWIAALHSWWTGKDLEKHSALQCLAETAQVRTQDRGLGTALLAAPSTMRKVYAQFPGCGYDRAGAMAKAFPTLFEAVMATEKEWAQVPGIGKTLAKRIVEMLHGRDKADHQ